MVSALAAAISAAVVVPLRLPLHAPPLLQPSPTSPAGVDYSCATCCLTFGKKKQLAQHLAGKRHAHNAAVADGYWHEFRQSSWSHESVHPTDVTSAWNLRRFLVGLPRRSRTSQPERPLLSETSDGCVSPHVTLSALEPAKRARLWRYLREVMPAHPAFPLVFERLEARFPRYARLKEILESCEVFRHAEATVLRSDAVGSPITTVFDVAWWSHSI